MAKYSSAILLAKLELFDDEVHARQKVAARYSRELQEVGISTTPYLATGNTSVFAQYTVMVESRAAVQEHMKKSGIPTAVHYPTLLCQQPALAGCGERCSRSCGSLNAQHASERVLSLPMHPYLSESDQDSVVAALAASIR